MKIRTWSRDHGWTFVVIFDNGTSGAEYVGLNPTTGEKFKWTEKQAKTAGERFQAVKGDNWEKGNLNYKVYDPKTGVPATLFNFVNFTI